MHTISQTPFGVIHTFEGAGPHPAFPTSGQRVLRVAVEGGSVSFVGGVTADTATLPLLDRDGRLLTLAADGWTTIDNPPPFIKPMFGAGKLIVLVGA